jgi:hypothetical protein
MSGHVGLRLLVNDGCCLSGDGQTRAGMAPGNPHGKATSGSAEQFRIPLQLCRGWIGDAWRSKWLPPVWYWNHLGRNVPRELARQGDQEFWTLLRLGRASGELRNLQWRRVVSSIERLRERQEAAGNVLRNQSERGGCLLFARRNGSAKLLEPNGTLPIGAKRENEPALEAVLLAMQTG